MKNCDLINAYLSAFYSGDFEQAKTLVAEDFAFKGPFVDASGRDPFFSSAALLARIVRGHTLLRQWEGEDEVSSIYEVDLETPLGKATVYMSEWNIVRNTKISTSRLVFDNAAFRAVVPMQ